MGAEIDRLEVQVEAQATKANNQLDKLIKNLDRVSGALSGLNSGGLVGLSNGVTKFAQASSQLSNVKTADFTRLTKNIEKLSNLNTQQIYGAASSMRTLSTAINSLGGVSANSLQVAEVANSISKLGGANVQRAIANLPALATAMNNFMATMTKAPQVNKNVIDMTNALANLASQGAKVGAAGNVLTGSINRIGVSMEKTTKKSRSFSSVIGSLYQKFFWIGRIGSKLWDSIENSMDYVEVLNYFDAAFGQVADSAVSQWENAGYDSAEAYYSSFSERAQQLTTKMTGFTITDSGMLESTGSKSLGINPSTLMNYQAMFAQMSNSMGVTAETSLKLSTALTEIGADLASVKNMDFDKVWTDMASGLAGMSRTLDKYGANIRNVNLQQKLTELGINANITALNQNEKALLRTIILLDSTRYAWGDLAETINQPANQLRLLKSNFSNLARTIGNIFLPIVAKVLPYLNAVVIALQRLAEWIVKLLGFEDFDWGSSSGIGGDGFDDLLGSIGDTEDGLNDAAGAAKKLKTQLLGIDELNVLNQDEDTTGGALGGLGGYGGVLEGALDSILDEYQKAWDEAFANIESRAQEIADKIQSFALKAWNAIEPFRNAVKTLWEEGLSKLANFTWTALKDFYENFLVPIGEWAFGTEDKGLTAFVNTLNDLLNNIDWEGLNTALKNLWIALEPFVEKVGDGLNWFFREVLVPFGEFLLNSVLIDVIEALADALEVLNDVIEFLAPIAKEFWDEFGKEIYVETLEKIAEAVEALLSPFESLKDLLDNFSWDNFLKYAKDVADFALLLTNPIAWFATRKEGTGEHESAEGNAHGGAGESRGEDSGAFVEALESLKGNFNLFFEDIGKASTTFFDDLYANKLKEFVKNTSDKWKEWKESISTKLKEAKEEISQKWQEIKTNTTEFLTNIGTNIREKWQEIKENISQKVENIKLKIFQIWDDIKLKTTDFLTQTRNKIQTTWTNIKNTISNIVKNIYDNISEKFAAIKTAVENAMKKASDAIDSFRIAISNAINKIKDFFGWSNKEFEIKLPTDIFEGFTEKVKNAIDNLKDLFDFDGKSVNVSSNVSGGGSARGYATGGYPASASLFWAGENGVPEILGTVGGRTAVAGGAEITGIRDAVYSTGQAETALLQTAVNLLQIIADKDASVNIDGRDLVNAYDSRKARNGYAF